MAFFNRSPEEIAAKEARKLEKAKQEEEQRRQEEERLRIEAELATPAGQAKAARADGAKTFQISLPLGETIVRRTLFSHKSTTTNANHSSVIDSIEAQGWRLENASYVYQITGSDTMTSGLRQGECSYRGETIGIYIFRISE